jgi:hypothetical protein
MVLKSPPIIRNAKSLSSSGGGDVQSVDFNGDVVFDQEAMLPGCTARCRARLTIKLCGANEAQRNLRPNERFVSYHCAGINLDMCTEPSP